MKTSKSNNIKNLLLVGPKPPPIGGAPLTVQAIIDEIEKYPDVHLSLVNTSPSRDVRKKHTGFNFEKVWRMFSLLPQYVWNLRSCDAVLVFANNLFAITVAPFFLLFARFFRKPYYLKPIGGDLDLFIDTLQTPIRGWFLRTLQAADGILAQTKLLQASLINYECKNVLYLPGFRTKPNLTIHERTNGKGIRLIYLGHIMRPKGPLVLLDALQYVSNECPVSVSCDFYGPVHHEFSDDFYGTLKNVPSAHYCGMVTPGDGPGLIATYDTLVLPTYFDCEGHTGVLIEAMHVGIPVISTRHRSVPELVTDGVNGLLVPPQDSVALSGAIMKIALDPEERKKMGNANAVRGEEFRTEKVVSQLIKIIFHSEE